MTRTGALQVASLLFLTGVVSFTACRQKQESKQPEHQHTTVTAMQDSIAVIPFQLENGGWGYKINIGPKTFIEQTIIPVIMGRKTFQSKEDALKVGECIASKMRKGEGRFPNLTRQELLDMKIAGVE
ncbi:DUF4907 domain-containing protein [Chitinophaga tropicalis]|nr:DUF4907 domain-containing protein [Chitinophaga tropicalis]